MAWAMPWAARPGRTTRILAGIGAGLALLSMPVGLIEMLVASSGLSEAWPAAAPPLGMKARLLIALFAGLMAAALAGILVRDRGDGAEVKDEERGDEATQGAEKMGFAFSRLTALARGRSAQPIDDMAPSLRRADAHPDAPARTPIFASRDFGGLDIFPRVDAGGRRGLVSGGDMRDPAPVASPGFSAPVTPVIADAPLPAGEELAPEPAFLRPAAPMPQPEEAPLVAQQPEPSVEQPAAPLPVAAALPAAPTQGLSVRELTERLERGLSLRSRSPAAAPARSSAAVIADMAVASPVPVRASVAEDTDEALRAALGALRSMAARAR